MHKNPDKTMNRRLFLKRAASAAGLVTLPTIIPASVLGKNGMISPSNKVTIGCIGIGNMGTTNMNQFLGIPEARVVAVCDLDTERLKRAKQIVDKSYGNSDCIAYHDFRDLIARNDIDAVSIATPDHWHAIPAIMAAESGKDIYGEKPLSHNFAEGRAMCDAVQRHNRIWQTGSWQRSEENFRFACELVRNGRIGKVHRVEVGLPSGYSIRGWNETGQMDLVEPPPELDYDFWVGPAPYVPYFPGRTHWNWRWQLAFGGGQLMDWVGHHVDIAHWGLDCELTGPVEIKGRGDYNAHGPFDAPTRYRIETKYRSGVEMVIAGGYDEITMGTKWIGEDGWVWVTRGDRDAFPKNLLDTSFGPEDIHLYKTVEHRQNFIDCVKTRKPTITPCEVAHRSATPGHLGQIAMLLGRTLQFDPDTETILNDETATRMMRRPMRKPWHL
ncbi:Gfo/Idh/MocA family oxidoreductase [candidate division KSB1 bacterium]|nr:Gfo/Idh/MocA family oxidoreductase [candidate division KSB1 bacterium]